MNVVERYFDAIRAFDWDAFADCVAEDVVRVGPFGDTYTGRADYVAFVSALMPRLPGYELEVKRITATAQGDVVMAEIAETIVHDGNAVVTPEGIVFDLAPDGRIARITIYIQTLTERVPNLAR